MRQDLLFPFQGFDDPTGVIDYYIPLKTWGVGLLYEGSGLENYSCRFTGPNTYAQIEFEDFIVLDFRTSQPHKAHTIQCTLCLFPFSRHPDLQL
jgi:hypothetical protein